MDHIRISDTDPRQWSLAKKGKFQKFDSDV